MRPSSTVSRRGPSVHYTPRRIAATLVEEAFDGLSHADRVRVLDPACGVSVFLVLAFDQIQIVQQVWSSGVTEHPNATVGDSPHRSGGRDGVGGGRKAHRPAISGPPGASRRWRAPS
jgi:hypothetical protein